MTGEKEYSWRKSASEAVDNNSIEKAFMDQAYGFVSNKAAALFKDPYRLGFEIVHKNDKSTRMLGIFAFRVGGAVLSAPVFFMNGEIKGADMLYRGDVKRFVPIEDWADYLTKQKNPSTGSVVPPSNSTGQRPASTDLQSIAYPMGMQKTAGESSQHKEILSDMLQHCMLHDTPESLLPGLIAETGPDTLEKVASLIEHSALAAAFLSENYTEEQLVPEDAWAEIQAAGMEKKASDARTAAEEACDSGLLMYTDIVEGMSKEAAADVYTYGYGFEDNRELPSHTTVFIDDDAVDCSISTPGVYNIVSCKSKTFKGLVLSSDPSLPASLIINGGSNYGIDPVRNFSYDSDHEKPETRVIDIANREVSPCASRAIFGTADAEFDSKQVVNLPIFTKPNNAKKGGIYVLVHLPSMSVSSPFCVDSVKKRGKSTMISKGYGDPLYYCADSTEDISLGHINSDSVLVKVKGSHAHGHCDTTFSSRIGGESAMKEWLLSSGEDDVVKTACSITKNDLDMLTLTVGNTTLTDISRREAITKMATAMSIELPVATALTDTAQRSNTTNFFVSPATMEKHAYMTRVIGQEVDSETQDPEFGVVQDSPSVQVLDTQTDQVDVPEMHIGDRDMGIGSVFSSDAIDAGLPDDLDSVTPDQLAQTAQSASLPHIFDHGVVGQLADKVYDSIAQVNKYIPKLESGLDHTGRILFLLRYKPTDFEEVYGSDAMDEMEQELASVFKSTGAMVLRLLRKSTQENFSTQING